MFTSFTQVNSAPVCAGPLPVCDPLPSNNSNTTADSVTLLAPFNGFPLAALTSLMARAAHQAHRMTALAARSGGALRLIRDAPALSAYLAERTGCLGEAGGCQFTAGLLGVEGAHALEGQLSNLDVLHALGFRLMGFAHFADNQAGGSQHGQSGGGLTPFGANLLSRLEDLGWVMDLAHSSEAAVADALAIARRPLLLSHTGAAGHCPSGRTLSDDLLRAVAAQGGVIGVGFWSEVTCGTTVGALADAILYLIALVGHHHVALGSDWDGCVGVPPGLDAAGMVQVTAALRARGVAGEALAAVMGGNALRLVKGALVPLAS